MSDNRKSDRRTVAGHQTVVLARDIADVADDERLVWLEPGRGLGRGDLELVERHQLGAKDADEQLQALCDRSVRVRGASGDAPPLRRWSGSR